jgi:hypothetical protein
VPRTVFQIQSVESRIEVTPCKPSGPHIRRPPADYRLQLHSSDSGARIALCRWASAQTRPALIRPLGADWTEPADMPIHRDARISSGQFQSGKQKFLARAEDAAAPIPAAIPLPESRFNHSSIEE